MVQPNSISDILMSYSIRTGTCLAGAEVIDELPYLFLSSGVRMNEDILMSYIEVSHAV